MRTKALLLFFTITLSTYTLGSRQDVRNQGLQYSYRFDLPRARVSVYSLDYRVVNPRRLRVGYH